MLRKSLILVSALSLILCIATLAMGLRSYRRQVTLCYDTEEGLPRKTKVLMCADGTLQWLELRTQVGGATSAVPRFAIPVWLIATAFAAGGVHSIRAGAAYVGRIRNA